MGPNCLRLGNIPRDSYEHKFENYYCKCKAFKKAVLYTVLTTLVIWYYQAIAEQKQQIKNAKISPFIHEWYQKREQAACQRMIIKMGFLKKRSYTSVFYKIQLS